MPPALSKTHYNCGHPRSKKNSVNAGRGFLKCKICRYEQRARRRARVIGPVLKSQKGRCAICRRRLNDINKLCQDHNHKHRRCNIIGGGSGPSGCPKCRRGILCSYCNGSLAMVENKRLLKAAIKYLKYWETQWIRRNM